MSAPAILLYAIVAAAVLIYVPFGVVALGRMQAGYDMAAPRALFDKLPSYAQRATWAHQNSFESFATFSVAALMAYVTQQSGDWTALAAIAYVVARLFYSIFYILNIPIGRSLMFGISTVSTATLFLSSLMSLRP
ncbi:MAG: MAPEG family protein [Cyanobacteria bacterium J069]|nr:MAG: MAPEG family protein [Cyanobacteria bacterium J069]